jgi:hypothetical protein
MPLPRKISSPVIRLCTRPRYSPDEPPPITIERPPGSRLPHTDKKVAEVRDLVENTALTYAQIKAATGVSLCSISRWTRDGKWARPLDAPRASDRVPTYRAGRKLRLRKLASRLQWLAEHYLQKLEETPGVDLDLLMQALQVLKMARLEAQGNRRRHPLFGIARTGVWTISYDEACRTALKELRRGGVDIDRAPKHALDLVIAAKVPPEDDGYRKRESRPRNPDHGRVLCPSRYRGRDV